MDDPTNFRIHLSSPRLLQNVKFPQNKTSNWTIGFLMLIHEISLYLLGGMAAVIFTETE